MPCLRLWTTSTRPRRRPASGLDHARLSSVSQLCETPANALALPGKAGAAAPSVGGAPALPAGGVDDEALRLPEPV
jgi:hypothetical protein